MSYGDGGGAVKGEKMKEKNEMREVIEEAIRVLENAPKWIPGKQRGKNVRVRMVIPVHFMMKER